MRRRAGHVRLLHGHRPVGRRRSARSGAIALSLVVLVGMPVAVVVLASRQTASVAPAGSEAIAPGSRDPHRPSAPFFANAGDGVRPDGIGCTREGSATLRAAVHLDVFADGKRVTVPAGVGELATCTYWVHTQSADGVIAITSPQRRSFTLGDFFDIWGAPLGRDQALSFRFGGRQAPRAFVNGRPVSGDPRAIRLLDRREIALVIGRRPPAVPASFAFGRGG